MACGTYICHWDSKPPSRARGSGCTTCRGSGRAPRAPSRTIAPVQVPDLQLQAVRLRGHIAPDDKFQLQGGEQHQRNVLGPGRAAQQAWRAWHSRHVAAETRQVICTCQGTGPAGWPTHALSPPQACAELRMQRAPGLALPNQLLPHFPASLPRPHLLVNVVRFLLALDAQRLLHLARKPHPHLRWLGTGVIVKGQADQDAGLPSKGPAGQLTSLTAA